MMVRRWWILRIAFISFLMLGMLTSCLKRRTSSELSEFNANQIPVNSAPWVFTAPDLLAASDLVAEQKVFQRDVQKILKSILPEIARNEPTFARLLGSFWSEPDSLVQYSPQTRDCLIRLDKNVIEVCRGYFQKEVQSERLPLLLLEMTKDVADLLVLPTEVRSLALTKLTNAYVQLAPSVLGTDEDCAICKLPAINISAIIDEMLQTKPDALVEHLKLVDFALLSPFKEVTFATPLHKLRIWLPGNFRFKKSSVQKSHPRYLESLVVAVWQQNNIMSQLPEIFVALDEQESKIHSHKIYQNNVPTWFMRVVEFLPTAFNHNYSDGSIDLRKVDHPVFAELAKNYVSSEPVTVIDPALSLPD